MLLHDSHAVDTLVVGDGLVIGGDEADDIHVAALFQDFDAHVAVQQPIAILFAFDAHDDRRLDNAHLADRCRDLPIFDGLFDRRGDSAHRLDVAKRDAQARGFKGKFDFSVSRAAGHWRLILTF
jgi:hypothetical protein